MRQQRLLRKLVSGSKNIRFSEVESVAKSFGFKLDRVSGSHHIFVHPEIPDLINLQSVRGRAKPYPVKQLLRLIEKHDLKLGGER